MQNKANLRDIQMNVTYVKIKKYEQKTMNHEPLKQTQSKPISILKTLLIAYNASKSIRKIERNPFDASR